MLEFRSEEQWLLINASVVSYIGEALDSYSSVFGDEIACFLAKYPNSEFVSNHRIDEISRACSDDLFRYATYHPVEIKEDASRYGISGQSLASHIVKWVMLFRPILIDSFWSEKSPEDVISKEDHYRRCNEIFSLFIISHIAAGPNSAGKSIPSITDLMGAEQLTDFLYTLRYRIKHQDVFKGWLWNSMGVR